MHHTSTGMVPLGNGLFYLAKAGKKDDQHTVELVLYRWIGGPTLAFEEVIRLVR